MKLEKLFVDCRSVHESACCPPSAERERLDRIQKVYGFQPFGGDGCQYVINKRKEQVFGKYFKKEKKFKKHLETF